MKKFIGTFSLGCESVRLYANSESGGSFSTGPEDNGTATMTIGLHQRAFWQVVAVLLHEAMELACVRAGLRYVPCLDYAKDNGSYLFSMSHTQFSEATAWASMLVEPAIPLLKKEWRKHQKALAKKKP